MCQSKSVGVVIACTKKSKSLHVLRDPQVCMERDPSHIHSHESGCVSCEQSMVEYLRREGRDLSTTELAISHTR